VGSVVTVRVPGGWRPALGFLAALLLAAPAPGIAQAASREGRTYLDIEYTVLRKGPLALRPYARAESRFRSTGLVYEQWNAGLRLRVLPWLSVAAYYTPREQLYPGKPKAFKNVAGVDVVLQPSLGRFRLLNRETDEWHATDGFHRYRNLLEIAYPLPGARLSPYFYDELRIDSDQGRVNMNDVGVGVQFNATATRTLRLAYDIEANRRLLPTLQYAHFVGLAVAAHL